MALVIGNIATNSPGSAEEVAATGGTAASGQIDQLSGPSDLAAFTVRPVSSNSTWWAELAVVAPFGAPSISVGQGSNHYATFQVTGVDLAPNQELVSARDTAGGACWRVDWRAGGGNRELDLYDANGTLITTTTEKYPDDFPGSSPRWEVVWTNDNSTTFKLWIGGVLVFDETGFDAFTGNSVDAYRFEAENGALGNAHVVSVRNFLCGNGVEADRLSGVQFRAYQNGETYSDSEPDSGTWAQAADTPTAEEADASVPSFDTGTNNGNVTMDDFSNARGYAGGPAGGRDLETYDTVLALSWVYNAKRSNGAGSNLSIHRTHDDHVGNEAIDVEGSLGTSYGGLHAIHGNVASLLSDFDPTTSHGMIGMGRYANGGRDIFVADAWFVVAYVPAVQSIVHHGPGIRQVNPVPVQAMRGR